MRRINWPEFYDGFEKWSLIVQKSYADDLEEFGKAEEVLEKYILSIQNGGYAETFKDARAGSLVV